MGGRDADAEGAAITWACGLERSGGNPRRFVQAAVFVRGAAEGADGAAGVLGRSGSIQRFAEEAIPVAAAAEAVRRNEFVGGTGADPAAVRRKSVGTLADALDDVSRPEFAAAGTAADAGGQDEHGGEPGSARAVPGPQVRGIGDEHSRGGEDAKRNAEAHFKEGGERRNTGRADRPEEARVRRAGV